MANWRALSSGMSAADEIRHRCEICRKQLHISFVNSQGKYFITDDSCSYPLKFAEKLDLHNQKLLSGIWCKTKDNLIKMWHQACVFISGRYWCKRTESWLRFSSFAYTCIFFERNWNLFQARKNAKKTSCNLCRKKELMEHKTNKKKGINSQTFFAGSESYPKCSCVFQLHIVCNSRKSEFLSPGAHYSCELNEFWRLLQARISHVPVDSAIMKNLSRVCFLPVLIFCDFKMPVACGIFLLFWNFVQNKVTMNWSSRQSKKISLLVDLFYFVPFFFPFFSLSFFGQPAYNIKSRWWCQVYFPRKLHNF